MTVHAQRDTRHDATTTRAISRDAAWLFAGFALSSGSGFLFWITAAVVIPQSTLGVEASVLSIVMAAAAFAAIGPGSALIVMLPAGGPAAVSVLRRAVVVTAASAVVSGVTAGFLTASLLLTEESLGVVVAVVTASTVVWALFNLQTQALAGAGSAHATAGISAGAGIGKVALVLLFGLAAPQLPYLLVVATLAPALVATTVSLLVVAPRAVALLRRTGDPRRRWDLTLARTFTRFTAQNTVATGLVLALGLSLSFLVTVLSSPAQGALFALTYQVSVALDLVGVGVATSLARNASVHFDASAAVTARLGIRVSVIVLALGVVATAATPALLWFLGDGYDPTQGVIVVAALTLASVLRPRYDLWSALLRARQRVGPVIAANSAWIVIVLGICLLLVPTMGATGAAVALLAGAAALAVVGSLAPDRPAPAAAGALAPGGLP